MGADGQTINFFSTDPALNPLLRLEPRPDIPVAWLWVLAALFVTGLLWSSFNDLFRGRRIPNEFSHSAIICGALFAPVLYQDWIWNYICAAGILVVFGGGFLIGGVGFGDVKLYLAIGLIFGPVGVGIVMLAQIYALVIGLPIALARHQRRMAIPMAPFIYLATTTMLALVVGEWWVFLASLVPLALVIGIGMLERRNPFPTLSDWAEPVACGQLVALRLAGWRPPLERSVARKESDGFEPREGARKLMRGRIDLLVHESLDHSQQDQLERDGQIAFDLKTSPKPVSVRIMQMYSGYAIEVEPAS